MTRLASMLAAILLGLLLWFLLAWGVYQAAAHEAPTGWQYPVSCCDARDCRHLEPHEVKLVPGEGYYLPEYDRLIPFAEANTSPDGDFHVCTVMTGDKVRSVTVDTAYERERMNRSGTCFWAPEGGM